MNVCYMVLSSWPTKMVHVFRGGTAENWVLKRVSDVLVKTRDTSYSPPSLLSKIMIIAPKFVELYVMSGLHLFLIIYLQGYI